MSAKIDIDIDKIVALPHTCGTFVFGNIQRLSPKIMSDANKILLCRLYALTKNEDGYCYASNRHLAISVGKAMSTITRLLSALKKGDYIFVEEIRDERKIVIQRRIFMTSKSLSLIGIKTQPPATKDDTPPPNNDDYSNENIFRNREKDNGSSVDDIVLSPTKLISIFEIREDIQHAIKYYFEQYKQSFGKIHPELKATQWERILDVFTSIDEMTEKWQWEAVIEKHLSTKYSNGCDFNINHFANTNIIQNRIYETMR